MGIVVQKYGGSSVADVEKLQAVAEKIVATKRAGNEVVAVVSAMGKTTDELLSLAHQVDPSPPRRELDMLLSTGERISMALLSMAIQRLGHSAISFTGSQSGIITNDRHFDAKIIDVRPFRIEDELVRGQIVIIAGYQGMSYKREITTLGRGGSDTTALAMAAALGATRAEIYSDVDGVYSADPRTVPDAKHLPEIGYEEMQQMAESGAKVLHSKAVEFARKARIAIRARSTFRPGKETLVHEEAPAAPDARAIVGRAKLAHVRSALPPAKLLATLGEHDLTPLDLQTEASGSACLVDLASSPRWPTCRDSLEATIDEDVAQATVIGGERAEIAQRVVATLAAAKLDALSLTTGPMRTSALVRAEHLDDAVRALHAALVTEATA